MRASADPEAAVDALRMWKHLMYESHPERPSAVDQSRRALELGYAGDWDAAAELLAQTAGELEQVDAPEAAAANQNLAAILQERGDLDGAVFHCVRSLFLYNQAHDLGGLFLSLRNLAVIHVSRGETGLSLQAQRQAARARRELVARGMLRTVEQGFDSRGERVRQLSLHAVQAGRLRAVNG
jgi:tetratricopeptide (TPR) repeat protein